MSDISHTVMVSACIITFNHEKFIEAAIEGALKQNITYSYEIVIADDHSTDSTRNICENFAKKNPDKIRLIANEANLGMQKNWINAILSCKGKYIAICEGDDFWTDPSKIQRQVDFLELHPDFILTFHNAYIINSKNELISNSKLPTKRQKDLSSEELIQGALVLTLTMCFRNMIKKFPEGMLKVQNVDTFLISILGTYGKAHFHEDIDLAAYRVHENGVWSKKSNIYKISQRRKTMYELCLYHIKYSKKSTPGKLLVNFTESTKTLIKLNKKSVYSVIYLSFDYVFKFSKIISYELFKKIKSKTNFKNES